MERPKSAIVQTIEDYSNLVGTTLRALESIPDGYVDFHTATSKPGEIKLSLPYDIEILREFRRELGSQWQVDPARKYRHGRAHSGGYRGYYYLHSSLPVELTVYIDPTLDGSVCRRVQVGEVTEPVYEIVCN